MSRAETHQQTLDELSELAMDVARILKERVDQGITKDLSRLVSAFATAALVVRRCILLSMWLDQTPALPNPPQPTSPKSEPPTPNHDPDHDPYADPTERAERAERPETLDLGPNPETALADGRFDAAIAALKSTLTLHPDLDGSPAAIATRLTHAHAHPRDG